MFLKIPVVFAVFSIALFLIVEHVQAIYDPTSISNNRFGIHIIDENDLEDGANLVNSNEGDWGYITMVIREDDRNIEKWQAIFDRMRTLHLIPIVRIATKVENGVWVKPRIEDIGSWVDFLNSLNWVIENRYVVIFNEPNHASEWGGEVNPEEYAWNLKEIARRLKEKSPDFFILPAGLDASAPNGSATMDESTYIKRMVAKEPDVFNFIDGWSSHSYPNPAFSGSPNATGKGTLRTYQWEMNQFGYLGINSLPIFITETGWRHSMGKHIEYNSLTPEQVARNYAVAFTDIWNDRKIVAVTPFLLNYQDAPFDHFSFKRLNSSEFYPMYAEIQSLEKTAGKPKQYTSVVLVDTYFPEKLSTGSDYSLYVTLENRGQTIIDGHQGWNFTFEGLPASFEVNSSTLEPFGPFHRTQAEIRLKTPGTTGTYSYSYTLKYDQEIFFKGDEQLTLVPPPGLLVNAKTWFERMASGDDYHLIIYDDQEQVVHKTYAVKFKNGMTEIDNLYNIIPNRTYRIVLTKPFYLPGQIYARLSEGKTTLYFPQLLPFDPSGDGVLTLSDIGGFFQRPIKSVGLFLSL